LFYIISTGRAYTFGVVLSVLSPVASVVIRSLLSKLVPKVKNLLVFDDENND
jgi:hypothetical protein